MTSERTHYHGITQYYDQSQTAYHNWGGDASRPGIYGLHFGYRATGDPVMNTQTVKSLTQKFINFAEISAQNQVLDAGCGSGAISFEIAERIGATVRGINIVQSQLNAANDIAVEAFLKDSILLHQMPEIIETVLEKHQIVNNPSIDEVFDVDAWARRETQKILDTT